MDVSIIFVNYNTCKLTLEAITSVYQFTKKLDFEVIVVDNASKDDSVSEIKKKFPDVTILKNIKNIGFGRANNQGMEISKGKYLFLLNTDTYLLNNAIELFFDFMEKEENSNVAVIGGQLYMPNGDWNVSSGPFPNYKQFVKSSFWKYFYKKEFFNTEEVVPIKIDSEGPYKVDYVSGADYFVRSEIIAQYGGFDSRFFMYSEEVELSYRIKNRANKISVIFPSAKIVHISQGSSAIKSTSKKFKKNIIKSRGLYYRITEGRIAQLIYLITSYKRIYFNNK